MFCRSVPCPFRGRRAGNVLVLVAVSLVGLMGVAALVIDTGRMRTMRRRAQTAADAAALAATLDLYNNKSESTARITALSYASRNSFANDATNSVVTVSFPTSTTTTPNPGPSDKFAQVTIQAYTGRLFSGGFGSGQLEIAARSVAFVGNSPASNAGLLLTNTSASGALSVTGNAKVTVTNASIVVDSNSSTAASATGSAKITAPSILISGSSPGYTTSGSAEFVGAVTTGATAVSDPLASLAAPDSSTMTVQSSSELKLKNSSTTLQPGVYDGGISLSANASVTLQPGTYYIKNGDLSMTGNSTLTGNGVTIYAERQISMTGNGAITLSPPTTGTYTGLTIFQDRTATNQTISLTGNANTNITGTVYAANNTVSLTGNSDTGTVGSQWICNKLAVSGNGTINVNWNQNNVAQKKTLALVE